MTNLHIKTKELDKSGKENRCENLSHAKHNYTLVGKKNR